MWHYIDVLEKGVTYLLICQANSHRVKTKLNQIYSQHWNDTQVITMPYRQAIQYVTGKEKKLDG